MNMSIQFTNDEKIEMFDELAEHFYRQNFGDFSKSDIELLMFKFYIEKKVSDSKKTSRRIQVECSDYVIGKELGITQQRVRNLKEKKELKYHSQDDNWVEQFIDYIPNARYDEVTHLVKVNIPDVNLMKDLRFFIEKNGWYDEFQLNAKLFQCRLDIFIDMCSNLPDNNGDNNGIYCMSGEIKGKLKQLKSSADEKESSALQKILDGNIKGGMKDIACTASKEILSAVLSEIPFGGLAKKAIDALVKVIKG